MVKICNYVSRQLIDVQQKVKDKNEAIIRSLHMLVNANYVSNADEYYNAVQERENIMSTGIGYGVAIPHGSSSAVKELKFSFLTLSDPIDFDSIDDKPVFLVFLIAIPETRDKIYNQLLGAISRLSAIEQNRQLLNQAKDRDKVMSIFQKFDNEREK